MSNRKRLLMVPIEKALPEDFQQVEWIGFNRSKQQYIDTERYFPYKEREDNEHYLVDCNFDVTTIFKCTNQIKADQCVLGASWASASGATTLHKLKFPNIYNGEFELSQPTNGPVRPAQSVYSNKYILQHKYQLGNTQIFLNGEWFKDDNYSLYGSKDVTLYIGNNHAYPSANSWYYNGYIYEIIINVSNGFSGQLGYKQHFIPCYRKSDGLAGLYDIEGTICSRTNTPFYINSGSGTFNVGPDILVE